MRGVFVTGTGTGVGKTVLSAALLTAMRAAGEPVAAYKPVLTGTDEPPGAWPADHELLALASGGEPGRVAPRRYGPAVSPHLAASLAGERIELEELVRGAQAAAAGNETLVVEGVGGLLVPVGEDFTVCDLAAGLGLPLLIAAEPGLGTINHTLLTLQAARAAGLRLLAVVLTPWPAEPSAMEHSNRETIERLGRVEVEVLPQVRSPDLASLEAASRELPWRRWLARERSGSSAA